MAKQIPCIRLTPTGDFHCEFRKEGQEVDMWLSYQERHHPLDALLISDRLVSLGAYPTREQAIESCMRIYNRKGIVA